LLRRFTLQIAKDSPGKGIWTSSSNWSVARNGHIARPFEREFIAGLA
jgi:hypothetical protein